MDRPFAERSEPPDDASLAPVLGRAKAHWDAILAHVEAVYADVVPEWKHYGVKHGWQLKLMRKRRAFMYLIPYEGRFVAGMALSVPEVAKLDTLGLPEALVEDIRSAKAYAEGRPARVEVCTKTDLKTLQKLLAVRRT